MAIGGDKHADNFSVPSERGRNRRDTRLCSGQIQRENSWYFTLADCGWGPPYLFSGGRLHRFARLDRRSVRSPMHVGGSTLRTILFNSLDDGSSRLDLTWP